MPSEGMKARIYTGLGGIINYPSGDLLSILPILSPLAIAIVFSHLGSNQLGENRTSITRPDNIITLPDLVHTLLNIEIIIIIGHSQARLEVHTCTHLNLN